MWLPPLISRTWRLGSPSASAVIPSAVDVGAEQAPVEVELADDERDESRHDQDIEG
jgi:hypothetical protein